jgi:putative serine protease PepD
VSGSQAGDAGEGLYLSRVLPGGSAASAGLRAGDVITKLDGQPNQLAAITLTSRPGDSVSVTYQRAGQFATTSVVLGAQP